MPKFMCSYSCFM